MSKTNEQLEGFLRNLEARKVGYSEEKIALSEMAKKGIDPCDLCMSKKDLGYTCATMQCLPYYRYFQYRWRRLQKGMLQK